MAKMTKTQLVAALHEATELNKNVVSSFLETLVGIAYKQTAKEGEFTIPGIGKLVKVNRSARMGVNPATGEKIKIPAKIAVKFRVAKAAKDAIL